MSIPEIMAPAFLFCWLSFEAVWDLRAKDHKLPVWFSLVMLIPGLIWLAYFVSPWAAILMAVSIASTEISPRSIVAGSLGMFATLPVLGFLHPMLMPLLIGWGIVMMLWSLRVIGGADALAAVSLLLFFPSWTMGVSILAGMVCWSLALLWWKYHKDVGFRLWAVITKSNASTRMRQAGTGAYALAVFLYFLYCLRMGRF
jgi:hypothetical protein